MLAGAPGARAKFPFQIFINERSRSKGEVAGGILRAPGAHVAPGHGAAFSPTTLAARPALDSPLLGLRRCLAPRQGGRCLARVRRVDDVPCKSPRQHTTLQAALTSFDHVPQVSSRGPATPPGPVGTGGPTGTAAAAGRRAAPLAVRARSRMPPTLQQSPTPLQHHQSSSLLPACRRATMPGWRPSVGRSLGGCRALCTLTMPAPRPTQTPCSARPHRCVRLLHVCCTFAARFCPCLLEVAQHLCHIWGWV